MSPCHARGVRFVLLAALAAATSCMSMSVDPASDIALLHAKSSRPALAFDYHYTHTGSLRAPILGGGWSHECDGEDLAVETARFREALEATEAFGTITRAKASDGLHGEFQFEGATETWGGGVLFGLSLGVIPDSQRSAYTLTARVRAPGREPKTYRAQTNGSMFMWLPLFPVGLVQSFSWRGDLQASVDSIVTQMANDGWLERR